MALSFPTSYDILVVGLGAMGSAALYQLAKRGQRVLGLDRFHPPHQQGSSHGDTRITRQSVAEGACYMPLVQRANELWRAIEVDSGEELLVRNGLLLLEGSTGGGSIHGQMGFVTRTMALAQEHGIDHEVLDAAAMGQRFPPFRLRGDEVGYFEPGAGFLRPERCIAAQLALAERHGAEVRGGEAVIEFGADARGEGVVVSTPGGSYRAGRLVIATGAWIKPLLPAALWDRAQVYRQVLHWFPVADVAPFEARGFPTFLWVYGDGDEDFFYGFPALDGPGGGIKLATETFQHPIVDPQNREQQVDPAEAQDFFQRRIAGRLAHVEKGCLRSVSCMYTMLPEARFFIDEHPDYPQVTLVSPCSGHGFKHSAALGEAIAQRLVAESSQLDLSPFALKAFGATP